jgi:hypothetical protein
MGAMVGLGTPALRKIALNDALKELLEADEFFIVTRNVNRRYKDRFVSHVVDSTVDDLYLSGYTLYKRSQRRIKP